MWFGILCCPLMSPAIWSLRVCTGPMADVLTVCLPFLGQGQEYWDTTCPDTMAPSYTAFATREAGVVAKEAESARYSHLERSHYFVPIAVETFGAFCSEARSFLRDLGHRIVSSTQDPLSYLHLKQRISVAVQRGNLVSVRGFSRRCLWRTPTCTSHWFFPLFFCFSFQFFFISVLFCFSLSRGVYHSPFLSYLWLFLHPHTSVFTSLRLVYIMTLGFALCCVATRSTHKMIWMTLQCRNRKFSFFCHLNLALPVATQRKPLHHIIKQP